MLFLIYKTITEIKMSTLEENQNKFLENRRWQQEAEQLIADPTLTQEVKDRVKTQLLKLAMENIHAANADPRVVDKTIELPRY